MRQAGNLEINRNSINPMHQLANDTGCYGRLAIWDMNTVFVTMTVHPQGSEGYHNQLGHRLPGYCTALGKAMLSHMPDAVLDAYLDRIELSPYTAYTITDKKKLRADLDLARRRGYSLSNREILLH